MKNIHHKESTIALLFLLAISLPVSGMWLKLDRFKQLNENRQLANLPPLGFTTEFRSAYTRYFNDHFGFRSSLVRANFIFRHEFLGISPSNQVVLGKNGWLFFTGNGEIEDFRGITKYDAKTLEKWAKTLEMKRIWLEKRGIRYLFVVPPNKSSIYGEFLPDSYNRVRENTALDEFFEYLKKHTSVKVVDFRQALLAAKSKERVYHRTNTHWNEYGAFIAYYQIMKSVVQWFPSLRIHTVDDYLIEKKIGAGGDLADMIGGTEYLKEEHVNLKPLDNHSFKIEDIDDITKSPITVEKNDSSFPRALIFRDSFFSSVAPFLAQHFHHSRYYWQNWNTSTPIEEIVNSQKPDIVIEEIVERLVKTQMADFVGNPPKFLADNLRWEAPFVRERTPRRDPMQDCDTGRGVGVRHLGLPGLRAGLPLINSGAYTTRRSIIDALDGRRGEGRSADRTGESIEVIRGLRVESCRRILLTRRGIAGTILPVNVRW